MSRNYSMSDLRKGLQIEIDSIPYKIVEYQHVKPGKGAAFVRCKIKNYNNGKVIEKTFHAGDKCQEPELIYKDMQYLYDESDISQFMDNETYEQIGIATEQCLEAKKWVLEGMNVTVLFHNGKAISIIAPDSVVLKVIDTPPNFKGDTTSGGKKPATLDTGATVNVPYHILEGDTIKINTIDGIYIEKVK